MTRLLPLLLALVLPAAGASEAPTTAQVLAASCSGCHSDNEDTLPRLDSITPAQLEATLLAFKSGARAGTLMDRIAKGFSDDDIRVLAAVLGKPGPP